MIDKALEHLRKKIDDKILQLQEAMADGMAQDFADYKKMVGEIQGLLTARLYTIDLQERLKESDDD
tara:strand:+ start:152 stop:349 length:198 start_codon:yes stop_codon:yes gene_type:complete